MKKTPNQLSRVAIAYHPGDTLKEKLNELGMSIKEFSVRTSKPEKTIIAVIKGTSSITSEMAVSFESVTRIPAHFWMNKQRLYDEYQIRMKREQTILQSVSWMRRFPVKEMANRGWIAACSSVEEKVDELFHFFGISTEKAWEDYYLNQELKIAFRISLAHAKEPEAISAWLRKGELQAAEIELEAVYSDKLLRSNLMLMKQLMVDKPEDFYQKLQSLCSKSGIILINTKCLPKTPINGATRWINDRPIIQLSNRYNRYDMFWFNFFHELGHILLHGKKDIFLEEAAAGMEVRKAKAAQDQAAQTTQAIQDKEAREAEYRSKKDQRKAAAERDAGVAEQTAKIAVAEARAKAGQAEADADRVSNTAKVEAEMAVEQTRQERQKAVNEAKAAAKEADLNASDIVPAQKEREKVVINADAVKQQRIIEAQADAEATLARAEAEAKATRIKKEAEAAGLKAVKLAEAEGEEKMQMAKAVGIQQQALAPAMAIERMIEAAGGDIQALTQLKLSDHIEAGYNAMTQQFEALRDASITVVGNPSTAGDLIGNLVSKGAPALQLIQDGLKDQVMKTFGLGKKPELGDTKKPQIEGQKQNGSK